MENGLSGCGKWMWKVESGAVPDLTLLITNRKSHTGFRLVSTLMTWNRLERRNSPYFAFLFAEFDSFAGRLCHSG